MTKKLAIIILGVTGLIILVGIAVPKVMVKNPDFSSSPCAENAVKDASKFPVFLIRTVKVNRFTISEVWLSYYTIFGVKINRDTYISCLLLGNSVKLR